MLFILMAPSSGISLYISFISLWPNFPLVVLFIVLLFGLHIRLGLDMCHHDLNFGSLQIVISDLGSPVS